MREIAKTKKSPPPRKKSNARPSDITEHWETEMRTSHLVHNSYSLFMEAD